MPLFHTIEIVLQKNDEGFEQPTAFFNKSLQDVELKYYISEKQAYALVREIKTFKCYLVGATIISFVPNAIVEDIFSQQEVTSRRCRWINRIEEFNIDVLVTKLVRGQGLAKLTTWENLDANHISFVEEENHPYIYDTDNCV